MLRTQLLSVDTLHVEVPDHIDEDDFNAIVSEYCQVKGYDGIGGQGGLKIEARDVQTVLDNLDEKTHGGKGQFPSPIRAFFEQVRQAAVNAGVISIAFEPLPPDVEEELLRQVLELPETCSPFYSTAEVERLTRLSKEAKDNVKQN